MGSFTPETSCTYYYEDYRGKAEDATSTSRQPQTTEGHVGNATEDNEVDANSQTDDAASLRSSEQFIHSNGPLLR